MNTNQIKKDTNCKIMQGTNNAVKCSKSPGESERHRQFKFYLACFCWDNGLDFATEVTFPGGQRGDFVVKDWGICLELLGSEKYTDFQKKTYPLPTIPINTKLYWEDVEKMMKDLQSCNGTNYEYYQKHYKEEQQ